MKKPGKAQKSSDWPANPNHPPTAKNLEKGNERHAAKEPTTTTTTTGLNPISCPSTICSVVGLAKHRKGTCKHTEAIPLGNNNWPRPGPLDGCSISRGEHLRARWWIRCWILRFPTFEPGQKRCRPAPEGCGKPVGKKCRANINWHAT